MVVGAHSLPVLHQDTHHISQLKKKNVEKKKCAGVPQETDFITDHFISVQFNITLRKVKLHGNNYISDL